MQKFLIFLLFIMSFLLGGALDIMDRTSGVNYIGGGSAGVARATSLYAPYWNPAGAAFLKKNSLGFNYYQRLKEVDHVSIDASLLVTTNRVLAFNFVQEAVSDIPETVDDGGVALQVGTFSDTTRIINGTYSARIAPGLYAGTNFKFLTHDIQKESGYGYGFDAGFIKLVDERTNLGLVFKNVLSAVSWSTGSEEQLEKRIVFGLSSIVSKKEHNKFILNFDYDIAPENFKESVWYSGGEYWLAESFALRAGVNGNEEFSVGFGFYYFDLRTDFAYVVLREDLENMFLFSFSLDFRMAERPAPSVADEQEDNALKNINFVENTLFLEEENKLQIYLRDYGSLKKCALITPDKKVFYFERDKIIEGLLEITYRGSGEYTLFFQDNDGAIFRQNIIF